MRGGGGWYLWLEVGGDAKVGTVREVNHILSEHTHTRRNREGGRKGVKIGLDTPVQAKGLGDPFLGMVGAITPFLHAAARADTRTIHVPSTTSLSQW